MPPPAPADSPLVRLSCVEDDALGEQLEVLWDTEVDARVVDGANWQAIASRGFDEPRLFSAYLNTLRWNCVTSEPLAKLLGLAAWRSPQFSW